LKLFKPFVISFLILSFNLVAKDFPEQFTIAYDLFQSSAKIGKINANYNQSKKNYNFHVLIKGRGIFKRMGNRHLISEGKIKNQKFYPIKFENRNSKSPKKNISSEFFYEQKKIKSNYKGRKIEKELLDGTLDLAIFLMQFNLVKKNNNSYSFKVFQGKKTRTYSYKKVKDESLEINKKIIEAELYEGVIIGKEKSVHHVWISKNNYRVPVKLTIPTDLGLIVNQELVSTNLPI
tara:strand:+ start:17787 stop:18488 length:702 start_codon:yes stop_codon:yes gene_type:complete